MFYRDMPKGVLYLNVITLFAVAGFAVLLGTLNLYLQKIGMPIAKVNTLTASFFALIFLLHFLGGSLGGTWISYRALFCFSLLLQIIGIVCIAIPHLPIILVGMGVFVAGVGLNVSCINMMLTQLFSANDMRRRTSFSINYAYMNIGFTLSYIVANIFQADNNYQAIFIFAAICIALALVLHLFAWRHLADKATYFAQHTSRYLHRFYAAPLTILVCLLLMLYLMHHPDLASRLIYVAFVLGFLAVAYCALRVKALAKKMWVYIILIVSMMMYAFIQGLAGTALQNFVKYNTNQSFLGLHIEPAGFQLAETLSVVIFGFLLAHWLKQRRERGKSAYPAQLMISRGLGFNVLAFLMLPLGIWVLQITHEQKVLLLFPILQSIFVAASEVVVSAICYSLAGELISTRFQGLFTGYMFLNIAFGTNLAGPFSNAILGQYQHLATVAASQTNPMYSRMFLWMALVALVATIIYWVLEKPITKLSQSN